MSNLNKLNKFYQILEKNPKLCLMRKKHSRTHKELLNNFFWPKIFITNTSCANVYIKCMNVIRIKCPIVKSLNKSNLWEFWAIDRTWPTLEIFYYSHFHK